jgi:hypothetical protein
MARHSRGAVQFCDAGRNAHLNAKPAAGLMETTKAGTLFVGTPEIRKLRILAHKQR